MRIFLAICLAVTLSACSGGGSIGSLNPFNWFKRGSQPVAQSIVPRRGYAQVVDRRPLIDQITALSVERTPYGVIVRATGLAPARGYHSADLVQVAGSRPGQLTFEFRASPPAEITQTGSVRLREIVAATYLSRQIVHGARQISVVAARNSRTIRP